MVVISPMSPIFPVKLQLMLPSLLSLLRKLSLTLSVMLL